VPKWSLDEAQKYLRSHGASGQDLSSSDGLRSWRKQFARQYHPDLGGDEAIFRLANTAVIQLLEADAAALRRFDYATPSRQSMTLSPGQEKAARILLQRLRAGERLTKISGYAGTGKTTLGRVFVERYWDEFEFRGAAPTGMAASRQQEAAGMPSTTLHRLLWKGAKGRSKDGELQWGDVDLKHMNDQLGRGGLWGPTSRKRQVLWIDEGSMIPIQMAKKIMGAVPQDVLIIVSGDPFQLQPINGIQGFNLGSPDAMLTEVHRQALDSYIIRLATWVRVEQRVPTAAEFERFGVPYFTAPITAVCEAVARRAGDEAAVVTFTHMARRLINRGARYYLDRPPVEAGPVPGERLMIRRNCKALGVFNGTMARVERCRKITDERLRLDYFQVDFEGVQGTAWLPAPGWIEDRKLDFDESDLAFTELREEIGLEAALHLIEAVPGSSGTCHAFQGSQFPSIFLVDEGCRDPHWWYTGPTRAEEKLVIGRIKDWRKLKERERRKMAEAAAARLGQAVHPEEVNASGGGGWGLP
jgi:exodeoxyribonuclease-5